MSPLQTVKSGHRDFIALDRSGSMAGSTWHFAIEAVNAYVRKLEVEKVQNSLVFATFHDERVNIDQFVKLPRDWYAVRENGFDPGGSTPLNDAIVALISLAEQGNKVTGEQFETCTFVFVTDGDDTYSQSTEVQAKEKIADALIRGWTVLFMGAGFNPERQAKRYGVPSENFIEVQPKNLKKAMIETAEARSRNVKTGTAIGYTQEQKLLLGPPQEKKA